MQPFIKPFKEIRLRDIAQVGGKNASLGEMFTQLAAKGIKVPNGFATTADAFRYFLEFNHLGELLKDLMLRLDRTDFSNLKTQGAAARRMIQGGIIPDDLKKAILSAYSDLCGNESIQVAVRSSATAEDLPNASFAGQHESYLNIRGETALLKAVQNCLASLYTDRAIKYREDNGFAHESVALSVGVQKMVRSDKSTSGVAFTLDPETGFRDVVHISGVWGLGENMVQGTVTPDEFMVFKPTLAQGFLKTGMQAIIQHKLGDKAKTMIYAEATEIVNIDTPKAKRDQFVLTDLEIETLAGWAVKIEDHYAKPMDIEWAKDGFTNEIFIIQARPETVHSRKNPKIVKEYRLLPAVGGAHARVLAQGSAIGSKVAIGVARILASPDDGDKLKKGEIIVTDMTSPDWDPILKKAAAIVTNKGGRTSHASIVARELGVPAVVGCGDASGAIRDGEQITVSCCEGEMGHIYAGALPFEETELDFTNIHTPKATKAMLIVADPDKAFELSFYPNDGVGLMRMEFIINHAIQVHPMALVQFDQLKDAADKELIEQLTHHYPDKKQYFVEKLSEGIAVIAAAFYPKEVILRMSDFKTNEYAHLIGGKSFEPLEENPMLGFRGASRYYNDLYKEGFHLECEAVQRVREKMGFSNLKVMIPFCRTVEEGKRVIEVMRENGLDRARDKTLKIYVMAEIPSNVLLADQFAEIFDGFSIGSNDLTQLTLGIDRDSATVRALFSELNPAVKMMISLAIEKAHAAGVKIGLCGQAPSDYPDFAKFLVALGIDSISFNPDALLKGIENINQAEAKGAVSLQPSAMSFQPTT